MGGWFPALEDRWLPVVAYRLGVGYPWAQFYLVELAVGLLQLDAIRVTGERTLQEMKDLMAKHMAETGG